MPDLDEEDRRVLSLARQFVPAWIARVDRVPPAELFETILAESAYAYELRGPRRRQAWENVKKMRSLVRRIQNRGYATMAGSRTTSTRSLRATSPMPCSKRSMPST